MKKNLHTLSVLILLTALLSASCTSHKTALKPNYNNLEIAQHAYYIDNEENIQLQAVEEGTIANADVVEQEQSEINQPVPNQNRNNSIAKAKIKSIQAAQKLAYKIESKAKLPLQKATAGTKDGGEKGLVATGIIFVGLGLLIMIPALILTNAGFLFIVGGIIVVLGGLLLLSGLARRHE